MAVRQQKWAQLSTLPDNKLTTFIFKTSTPDSRLKVVNDQEVLIDGKLYDVVRTNKDDKSVTYYCIQDQKEQTLIAKTRLFNSKAQQMPHQKTTRMLIDKIIKTGIVSQTTHLFSKEYKIVIIPFKQAPYSGPSLQIAIPPPQSFC